LNCCVVDTVILRYFLLVDEFDLLLALLEGDVLVPRVVFDPDELESEPELTQSEMSRSIKIQAHRSQDPTRNAGARATAAQNSTRLAQLASFVAAGKVQIADLDDTERRLFAELVDGRSDRVALKFPLGRGEAACVAIAAERGCVFVSDDNDGLLALEELDSGHPYERVRRLLTRAGETDLISEARANEIHQAMVDAGFRDTEPPFPSPSS
jgi:predicted nucleic acid-binding protein